MLKYLFLILSAGIIFSCKNKKPDLKNDDEVVEVGDFIDYFPEIKLPIKLTDTGVAKKLNDSAIISYKIFTQFVPDSVLQRDFGKTARPVVYAIGKVQEKSPETYLFVKAIQAKKGVGYVVAFDKKNNYLSTFPMVKSGPAKYTSSYGLVDRKFQVTTYNETKKPTGETWYKRNVYVYNAAANEFMLILTEPNEEMIETIINPIDTLAKKNRLSGDYIRNEQNFISIRDGKDSLEIPFFIHFEKDNAECVGELKGTARLVSPTKARYKENGNPCTIEFTFSGSSVTMKEIEGCGSYRDIKCFFEGRFTKKKEPKPKSSKKKK